MNKKEIVWINFYDDPSLDEQYGGIYRSKKMAEDNCYTEGTTLEAVIEFKLPEKTVSITKTRIEEIYKSWGNTVGKNYFKDFLIKVLFDE